MFRGYSQNGRCNRYSPSSVGYLDYIMVLFQTVIFKGLKPEEDKGLIYKTAIMSAQMFPENNA